MLFKMSPSLYCWFSSASNKPYLPDPTCEQMKKKELEVANANKRVAEAMETQPRRRKRSGTYTYYPPELRAKIGNFAAQSGNKAAVEKFSKELGKPVSESTVRGFKKNYYEASKRNWTGEPIARLEHGLRLKLGDLDSNVQDYIRKLRVAGGVVNRAIAAKGIVEHHNPAMLREHGGTVELGKKWADSILSRMNFVKRKATKAARKLPTDFPCIKLAFLKRVSDCVHEHRIPQSLLSTGTRQVLNMYLLVSGH